MSKTSHVSEEYCLDLTLASNSLSITSCNNNNNKGKHCYEPNFM